jgi:hypothetical protein
MAHLRCRYVLTTQAGLVINQFRLSKSRSAEITRHIAAAYFAIGELVSCALLASALENGAGYHTHLDCPLSSACTYIYYFPRVFQRRVEVATLK